MFCTLWYCGVKLGKARKMKKGKVIKCKAYCKHGGKCNNAASIVGYCVTHYLRCKEDVKRWEKSQERLKAQGS